MEKERTMSKEKDQYEAKWRRVAKRLLKKHGEADDLKIEDDSFGRDDDEDDPDGS